MINKSLMAPERVKVLRMPNQIGAQTHHFGGKNGQSVIRLGTATPGAETNVLAHEMAHARVRRPAHRLTQIMRDPIKNAREEARADFVARGGKKPNRGDKTRSFYEQKAANPLRRSADVKAYREVQRKMRGSVSKGFVPWDGITSEVSKMGPEISEVHVVGSNGRSGRLKKVAKRTRSAVE